MRLEVSPLLVQQQLIQISARMPYRASLDSKLCCRFRDDCLLNLFVPIGIAERHIPPVDFPRLADAFVHNGLAAFAERRLVACALERFCVATRQRQAHSTDVANF